MLHAEGSFDRLLSWIPELDGSRLWPIIFRLEEGRTGLRNRLQDIILRQISDGGVAHDSCRCHYTARHIADYRKSLERLDLVPNAFCRSKLYTISVSSVIYKLEELFNLDKLNYDDLCWISWHEPPNVFPDQARMLKRFAEKRQGLCLDCVRTLDLDDPEAQPEHKCRVLHEAKNRSLVDSDRDFEHWPQSDMNPDLSV